MQPTYTSSLCDNAVYDSINSFQDELIDMATLGSTIPDSTPALQSSGYASCSDYDDILSILDNVGPRCSSPLIGNQSSLDNELLTISHISLDDIFGESLLPSVSETGLSMAVDRLKISSPTDSKRKRNPSEADSSDYPRRKRLCVRRSLFSEDVPFDNFLMEKSDIGDFTEFRE